MVVRHGDGGRSGELLLPQRFKRPGKSTLWLTPVTATSGRRGFLAGTGGGEALAETLCQSKRSRGQTPALSPASPLDLQPGLSPATSNWKLKDKEGQRMQP